MSVKLLDNSAFYGFRVRRTIEGKVYQEYFSLKANGERLTGQSLEQVEVAAQARDQELFELQQRIKAENKANQCFRDDGSVRGLSYLLKQEKSGNKTPIYQLGISSVISKKILCTSVSIAAYGEDEAWRRVVGLYCQHKNINLDSELHQKLLAAKPVAAAKKTEPRQAA